MKRRIIFRGKNIEGFWIYGDLFHTSVGCYGIFRSNPGCTDIVDSRTVSQYTGYHDCQNDNVYVGDILEGTYGRMVVEEGEIPGEGYGCFWERIGGGGSESMTGFIDEYKIIGNIWDNPELLKEETNVE